MDQEMKIRLIAEVAGFDAGLKNGIVLYDRFGKQMSRISNQVEGSVQKTERSFNNLGRVSGSAGSSVLAFSRIVQDAPFGIIGVGNNITQLVENFGALRAESKSTGSALKQMFTAMIQPGNLLVLAISAATTALTFFAMRSRGAKDETESLSDSLLTLSDAMREGSASATKDLTALDALYNITQDVTRSIEERKTAVDELQAQYPKYFGNIEDEKVLIGEASNAYKSLRENIIGAAQAQALMDQVIEREKAFLELQPQKLAALEKSTEAQQRLNDYLEIYNATSNPDIGMINHLNMLRGAAASATRAFQDLVSEGDSLRKESQDFADQLNNFSTNEITGNFGGGKAVSEATKSTREQISAIESGLKSMGVSGVDTITSLIPFYEKWHQSQQKVISTGETIGPAFARSLSLIPPGMDAVIAKQQEFNSSFRGLEVLSNEIGRTVGDMYGELIVNGEDAFENINELFNRMLKRMISDIISSGITNALAKLFATIAGGGAGGGIGSILNGISGVSLGADQQKIGAGIKSMTDASKSLTVASQALAAAGSAALSSVMSAIPVIGAGIAASAALGRLLSGGKKEGALLGALIGPIPGAILSHFTSFAKGGIVSGPTLSITGDYPGVRSNPEVIAPLNKLHEYIDPPGRQVVVLETQLRGDDIYLVNKRAADKYNRFQ